MVTQQEYDEMMAALAGMRPPAAPGPAKAKPAEFHFWRDFPGVPMLTGLVATAWPLAFWHGTAGWVAEGIWSAILAVIGLAKLPGR